MPDHPKPNNVTLRAYNVGFGDCFLLTFHYAEFDRHVLIDFGSMKYPPNAPSRYLAKVADQIKTDCGGELHAIVATHRHRDHIRGFERNEAGTGPGDVIASCNPGVVIQPWTEDLEASEDGTDATVRTRNHAFRASLAAMNDVAEAVIEDLPRLRGALSGERFDRLKFIGEDNIKNVNAVKALADIGDKNVYVKFGVSARLTRVLPGVKVHVLGPPSLEQTDEIRSQRDKDAVEFWQLQARATRSGVGSSARLFPHAEVRDASIETGWFRKRVRQMRADSLYQIVTQLDEQLNNTSVILLFETQGQKFLFPGDAQYENWMYALNKPSVRNLLEGVDVYKVGHHGSRNATPKTLWGLFENRGPEDAADRIATINSTLAGFHGHGENSTEVPRTTLVSALEEDSEYTTTEGKPVTEPTILTFPLT